MTSAERELANSYYNARFAELIAVADVPTLRRILAELNTGDTPIFNALNGDRHDH